MIGTPGLSTQAAVISPGLRHKARRSVEPRLYADMTPECQPARIPMRPSVRAGIDADLAIQTEEIPSFVESRYGKPLSGSDNPIQWGNLRALGSSTGR